MKLTVNGEEGDYARDLNLGALLKIFNIPLGRVACEVNGRVVRRAEVDRFALSEGDIVEILQMIGGG